MPSPTTSRFDPTSAPTTCATSRPATRERSISLVIDLVLNHVAPRAPRTRRARRPSYRDRFRVFPDRERPTPKAHAAGGVPRLRAGGFTWDDDLGLGLDDLQLLAVGPELGQPGRARRIADVVLELANLGIRGLRLDAIAFVWEAARGTDFTRTSPGCP